MEDPFLFIVGRGRSGTTLIRSQLDTHPDLAVVNENHAMATLVRKRRSYETARGFDAQALVGDIRRNTSFFRLEMTPEDVGRALSEASPRSLADAVRAIYRFYAARRGKSRYADKNPNNVLHVGPIAELFPEARFLHVIRDGRDSTLSYLAASFGPTNVAEAALYWRRFVGHGRREGLALGPDRYRELRYEDLLADPEKELRAICAFIGLPFDDAMLRYYERAHELIDKDHPNLGRPPTKGIRDWRREMDPGDVVLFEALAGDLLDELGYERSVGRIAPSDRLRAGTAWLRVQGFRLTRRTRRTLAGAPATNGNGDLS